MKPAVLLCTALGMALGTLACGTGGSDSESDAGSGIGDGDRTILRVAYNREIDVLNALTSQMLLDVQFSMVEGLVTTDENNSYIPVLAKEIPTVDNGLVVRNESGTIDMTWELQEGVRWHDGEPFTSEDVCFTWRFVSSDGSSVYNRGLYLAILDCLMPDDHTVVFRWDGVRGYYAGLFEAVLPEHILGHMTTEEIINYTPYNRGDELVGTGPFRFVEWRAGEHIRVVRNDDYWRGRDYPLIDEVVWSFIPDSNTRLNALKSGLYHYGQVDPVQVAEIADLEGYAVHLISTNGFMHFDVSLNTERSRTLFSDLYVRRAMGHAIDRRAIAEQLMQGTVTLATSPLNPSSPFHNSSVTGRAYDPAQAVRLLDRAGWAPGDDGIRVKDGLRFSFTVINRAGSADRIAIAQVIQAQLKDVGIAIEFETLEAAAWTQAWRNSRWEGLVSAWFLPADPSVTGLYACDGANNFTAFCDPTLDEVLKRSDQTLDFTERKQALDEAQALLAASDRYVPIYYNVTPEVLSTQVGNYRGSGTNFGSFWNLYEWTLRD